MIQCLKPHLGQEHRRETTVKMKKQTIQGALFLGRTAPRQICCLTGSPTPIYTHPDLPTCTLARFVSTDFLGTWLQPDLLRLHAFLAPFYNSACLLLPVFRVFLQEITSTRLFIPGSALRKPNLKQWHLEVFVWKD